MERGALLPCDADVPASFDQIVDRDPVRLAVGFTVQEQHICPLGLRYLYAVEVVTDKINREVDVVGQYETQLIHPNVSLRLIRSDQRVHGQNVHRVIVAHRGLPHYSVAQIAVVYDVITADQSRKVKGLAGSVDGDRPLLRVIGDALRRDMPVPVEQDIRPYLVRDHDAVVPAEHLHRLFQLLPLPDAAAGIVRAAKDRKMDMVRPKPSVHILIVHAPYTVCILFQRAELGDSAGILQYMGKADVGWAVEEHLFSRSGKRLDR